MTIKEFENRAKLNGGYDRKIQEWKIIDIHQIPDAMLEQHEIDFYCCNNKKVYLLRLRNRTKEMYSTVNNSSITYLIAELPINTIDNTLIINILNTFTLD